MPAVTVCSQVYNSINYLPQCIESVLNQTFSDFELIILDNGCTDGSQDILRRYAKQDSRIKLVRYEINKPVLRWLDCVREYGTGKYLAIIDSDDWWEPDFLERMIKFLEENNLDLATTGTMYYRQEDQKGGVLRRLEKPAILTQQQFAQGYPAFCMYPNTMWGSIMKTALFWKADLQPLVDKKYPFGLDTICMLEYIKQCNRIGIDNSVLYHYRIHPKGITYHYSPLRLDGILARRDRIKDFLVQHQAMPPAVEEWWMRTHLVYMNNALKVLRDSDLDRREKLKECARFAAEPMTPALLRDFSSVPQAIELQGEWRTVVWDIASQAAPSLTDEASANLSTVLQVLCPKCCGAVQPINLLLFREEHDLCAALLADDADKMLRLLLTWIMDGQDSRGYQLEKLVQCLISKDSPLSVISDPQFFVKYAELCLLILDGNYLIRLEDMTGSLMRDEIHNFQIDYLNLYLTLAALEGRVSAFLFGKLQLAEVDLALGQREECRKILNDLEEMGMAENEAFLTLQRRLAQN